jgi:hypothetical protein
MHRYTFTKPEIREKRRLVNIYITLCKLIAQKSKAKPLNTTNNLILKVNMSDLMNKGVQVLVGVIAIIVAATAIASTNSAVVGTLAWLVLGFVVVGLAIRVFKEAYGG